MTTAETMIRLRLTRLAPGVTASRIASTGSTCVARRAGMSPEISVEIIPTARPTMTVRGAITVVLNDPRGELGGGTVRLEQEHHAVQGALGRPGLRDLLRPAGTDPGHLAQARGLAIENVQALHFEVAHDALRERRPDTGDDAGAQVAGEPVERARRHGHEALGFQLLAVPRILLKIPGDAHAHAGADRWERADDRHRSRARAFALE